MLYTIGTPQESEHVLDPAPTEEIMAQLVAEYLKGFYPEIDIRHLR